MYKKVSKQEFFAAVGDKDVVLEVKEPLPYKTLFKLRRSGHVVGYIVDSEDCMGESEHYIEQSEGGEEK